MARDQKRRTGSAEERRAALEQTTLAASEILQRSALDRAEKTAKLRGLRLDRDQTAPSGARAGNQKGRRPKGTPGA